MTHTPTPTLLEACLTARGICTRYREFGAVKAAEMDYTIALLDRAIEEGRNMKGKTLEERVLAAGYPVHYQKYPGLIQCFVISQGADNPYLGTGIGKTEHKALVAAIQSEPQLVKEFFGEETIHA